MSINVASTAELGTALTGTLVERGLQVDATSGAGAAAALPGPLLVIRLPLRPDAGMEVVVATLDRQDQSGDQVVQALAQALASTLGDLVVGDASVEVSPNLEPVLAGFTAPADAGIIVRAGSPVGAVLWAVDRRRETMQPGPGAAGTGAPAGGVAAPAAGTNFGMPSMSSSSSFRLNGQGMHLLRDVNLDVSVELGRTVMTVAEVLELSVGSVIELDRAARAPVDIRVNGTLLAKGEVVVIDDEYAVRVTDIIDPTAGFGA